MLNQERTEIYCTDNIIVTIEYQVDGIVCKYLVSKRHQRLW